MAVGDKIFFQKLITEANKLPSNNVSGLSNVANTGNYSDLIDTPQDSSDIKINEDNELVLTTEVHTNLDKVPEIESSVIDVNDKFENYSTTEETSTLIDNKINTSISSGSLKTELATKVDKTTLNNYPTTSEMTTAISNAVTTKMDASLKGASNGVAELGSDGKIPAAQLPSYVDDVVEFDTKDDFPSEGETGKIYIALDKNITYRWSGSTYVEIGSSLALGETESTAYAGNKGKANADSISELQTTIITKQDIISDLETIRDGAAAGATAVQPSALATVAISGSYDDLLDKPSIPSEITEDTVSGWGFTKNTGTYSKPNSGIPKTDLDSSVQSSLEKADSALQAHQDISGKENTSNKVTSWSVTTTDTHYPSEKLIKDSLDGKANSSHTHTKSQITDFPSLSTVATSGSYNDLSNKPTIPTVNNATLTIQKNGNSLATFTSNSASNATANIIVPTKVSELTNDSGFTTNTGTITGITMNGSSKGTSGVVNLGTVLTAHQDISGKANLASPAFTGTPTAPTASIETYSTQIATTAFARDLETPRYVGAICDNTEITGYKEWTFDVGNAKKLLIILGGGKGGSTKPSEPYDIFNNYFRVDNPTSYGYQFGVAEIWRASDGDMIGIISGGAEKYNVQPEMATIVMKSSDDLALAEIDKSHQYAFNGRCIMAPGSLKAFLSSQSGASASNWGFTLRIASWVNNIVTVKLQVTSVGIGEYDSLGMQIFAQD